MRRHALSSPRFDAQVLVLLLLTGGLWLLPGAGRAQLNIEALATTVKEPGNHSLLNSSVSFDAGNVALFEVTGQAAYVFTNTHPDAPDDASSRGFWFRDRLLTYGGASFKRTPQARLANGGFIHLRYTRMQWLKVGFETFFQLQYDEFRLLSRRVVGGGGGRFVLARVKNFAAWLGTGYMVEGEKRHIPVEDQPPLGPDSIYMVNHRWNNYFTVMAMQDSEQVALANTVYIQPRLDDPGDTQILDELTLKVSFDDRFSLTIGLVVRYDSRAPRSVLKHDVQLTQGLTVTL